MLLTSRLDAAPGLGVGAHDILGDVDRFAPVLAAPSIDLVLSAAILLASSPIGDLRHPVVDAVTIPVDSLPYSKRVRGGTGRITCASASGADRLVTELVKMTADIWKGNGR